jgi:YVTN family beta-propeller protein
LRIIAVVLALAALCAQAAPFAYVPESGSDIIRVVDTATRSIVSTQVVGAAPAGVAISPDGTVVFVANRLDGTVTAMTATGSILATIPVGNQPQGLAFDRAADRVYVTNSADDSVSAIDAATLAVVATIPVGDGPLGIVVNASSATSRVYVANANDGTISVLDASLAPVTIIALAAGSSPVGLALDPSGSVLYVANFNANTIDRFATATNASLGSFTLPIGSGPENVVVDHAGTHVYATGAANDTVIGFDTATGVPSFSKAFAAGAQPWGIDIDAADELLYVTLAAAGTLETVQTASPFGVVDTYTIGPLAAPLGRFIGPGPPAAPLAVSAVAGNGQVTVSFAPPASDGGTAITSYTATCAGQSASGAGAPIVVAGLANGTAVTCTVVASNAMGAGPASAPAGPVTPAAASIGARDVPALSRAALAILALLLAAMVLVRGRGRR